QRGGRPGGDLLPGQQLEDGVGPRRARVEGLHVDVQVRAEVAGVAQQLAQAPGRVALAALRRVGAQQRRQRRDLDRQVHARERARAVGLERRARRQLAVDVVEAV